MLNGWLHGTNPVLALTFQQGAAAESLHLLAIDGAGREADVAHRDAAAVELRVSGRGVLVLVDASGSGRSKTCLSWDDARRSVTEAPCD